MSGICGIFESGREISPSALAPMLDALTLAGESGQDFRAGFSVGLGVARRWNFQQLAVRDHVVVAADADLVDRAALLRDCGISHEDKETTIADLLAQLYLRYDLDCLKRLHGAFVLALWDARAKRLVLAIDKLGIRSLYFRNEAGRTLFASRISAIRVVQQEQVDPDPRAVLQYLLFANVPAPLSVDRGTQKLQPGSALICSADNSYQYQYWDLLYPEDQKKDAICWTRELQGNMRAAVQRHLEGTQPSSVGAYLSGGTDSSSVVAFISEKQSPANTFSIAFDEEEYSELSFARIAATRFKTRHWEKLLTPNDAWGALDDITNYYDEPFANSSVFGSYFCARLARENGIDTLLAGDGGDELFGGNSRYARDKYFQLYQSLPLWLRRGVVEPVCCGLLPNGSGLLSFPARYIRRANMPNPGRILSYGFFLNTSPAEIFDSSFLRAARREDWLAIPERHYQAARATHELNRILYLDVKMTLADNDLRKVSGSAEIAGVNVRYPLLDDRLAEFSGRIPVSLKLKGFEKRYIFKQAMKGILPNKILYKKKHGFGVPLSQWLLGDQRMRELLQDVMHDQRTRQRGYFQPDFFERLLALHRQQPNYYGEIVWYLVSLELWHRRHHEGARKTAHAI